MQCLEAMSFVTSWFFENLSSYLQCVAKKLFGILYGCDLKWLFSGKKYQNLNTFVELSDWLKLILACDMRDIACEQPK